MSASTALRDALVTTGLALLVAIALSVFLTTPIPIALGVQGMYMIGLSVAIGLGALSRGASRSPLPMAVGALLGLIGGFGHAASQSSDVTMSVPQILFSGFGGPLVFPLVAFSAVVVGWAAVHTIMRLRSVRRSQP
jgi:hypothetical protein